MMDHVFGMARHPSLGLDRRVDDPHAILIAGIERTAALLCQRWKPSIIYLLGPGPQRYNALARRLPNVSAKMLTQQLRALEREGLVQRTVYVGGRRHVEYALTARGQALRPAVETMLTWSRTASLVPRATTL